MTYFYLKSRGCDLRRRTGLHSRWCCLRQKDDPDTHHGEGGRRYSQYCGARYEVLFEQPHAQGDANDRIDDDQDGLGDPQRSDVKRRLLQQGARRTSYSPMALS